MLNLWKNLVYKKKDFMILIRILIHDTDKKRDMPIHFIDCFIDCSEWVLLNPLLVVASRQDLNHLF